MSDRKPRQRRTVAERAEAEVRTAEQRLHHAEIAKRRTDEQLTAARAVAEAAAADLVDAQENLAHARTHPALPKDAS
jgi:hypothetical protein